MKKEEREVIEGFLVDGHTRRKLDELLGLDPAKSRGTTSHRMLKKFGLKDGDNGKLSLYPPRRAAAIIKQCLAKKRGWRSLLREDHPGERTFAVIKGFLKDDLPKRRLDKILGENPLKTKGAKSQEMIERLGLEDDDKGKLFLYSEQKAAAMVKQYLAHRNRHALQPLIEKNPPPFIKRYRDVYVLAKSAEVVSKIFDGQICKIVQNFFSRKRKRVGECQLQGCRAKKLETAHLETDRPEIFEKCLKLCQLGKKNREGLCKFDMYDAVRLFLLAHRRKKSYCFLCEKHHKKLDGLKETNKRAYSKFKKRIIFQESFFYA